MAGMSHEIPILESGSACNRADSLSKDMLFIENSANKLFTMLSVEVSACKQLTKSVPAAPPT